MFDGGQSAGNPELFETPCHRQTALETKRRLPAQVTEPDEEKYRLPPVWDFATETAATGTHVAGAASVVSTTVDAATTKKGAAWGRTSALGKAHTALGNSPGARTALGNSPGARTALGNSPGARTALSKSHRARRRESRRQ
jgi:hypothetical protein